jgi:hypothetical protein
MTNTRRLGGLGLAAAFLLVAGCSDSLNDPLSSAEEAELNLDVAAYAADATFDDIAMMTDEADQVLPIGPLSVGHFSDRGTGRGRLGDYQVSRSVTFYDSLNAEMDAYSPLLTDWIHILFEMEGSRARQTDRGTLTHSISRTRDMTISGLLGEETKRTWNGTGSSAKNASVVSDATGDRSYSFSASTVITAVVIPVPRGSGWPLSGTIERTIKVERMVGDEVRTRNVVVEFNGTHLVPIWVNDAEFTLNLETRRIVRPSDET